MSGGVRLFVRALLSLLCILLVTCVTCITWTLGARRLSRRAMRAAFLFGTLVWNVRITTQGQLAADRPLLIVSNHFSYLDLFALGSRIPAAFTPKSEIGSWPVIGVMCRMAGCLFIDRRTSQTLKNKDVLADALRRGDIISLFPEGTTSDGTMLLPFKSAFFSLAMETGITVQPVSIVYTRLNGRPVDRDALPVIGWYGDTLFFPHVSQFMRQRSVDITLVYHAPVSGAAFASRKELALYCHDVIAPPLQAMSAARP